MALAVASPAFAAKKEKESLPDNTLSEWSFGEAITGDTVVPKELKGKVVVIEYWGTR